MSYPLRSSVPSGPRRRSLLASVAGGALLAGCSDGSGGSEESTSGSQSVTRKARALAARDSVGLLGRYDAVIAAHPAVAGRLGPLRAEVVRHAEAFGGTVTKGATGTPAAPSPSGAPATPTTEKAALSELAAAERTLSDRRLTALADLPPELARLLASVAAAGAAHAYLLTEDAR
ncbi:MULTISPECIES: hypothetical protein [unclassified Streptomyces]|uniref:hypothetical protein n=1 Tax=unclassified Streptomyces TaxID=2593676 RepID=UPI000D3A319E|nr:MULTISPECIES: hypothetical protein [unclassified Streptomyces]PTM83338.1 hypothetical protein C7821_12725 [Streptomyces sp. VMFN-G11Ma]